MFAPDELLLTLTGAGVNFVVIGGVAVGVHGFVRATEDLDVVPAPQSENLDRLARALGDLQAVQVGVGDFAPEEFPYDPTDPHRLAEGANFRLDTSLGPLDIMQWVAGVPADHAYAELASRAITVKFRDIEVRVCGLEDLQAMKRAAGRPQDLRDLERLQSP